MKNLTVVPHDVFVMLQNEGIELSRLDDINYIAEKLAASDMADITRAIRVFPFKFSPELKIQLAVTPLDKLAVDENKQDLYYRVNSRYETSLLQALGESEETLNAYTLYPVTENQWVAVQQRLRKEPGDPSLLLLKANNVFFDDMVAQALHTLSFEDVCSTNLFTYYLGSL